MPEPESPKTQTPRQKTAAKATTETTLCHIRDEVPTWKVDRIHNEVCVPASEYPLTEFEGKHYCIFHLPNQSKSLNGDFDRIFDGRLKEIEAQIAAVEDLPANEKKNKLSKISYNFHYVWFPAQLIFINYQFKASVSFNSATFNQLAEFDSATFTERADFRRVTFMEYAGFNLSTFTESADFSFTKFTKSAHFNSVNFKESVYFNSAVFSRSADFRATTFISVANFSNTNFGKAYQTQFDKTNFANDVYFDETEFNNDVSFNAATFGSDSYVVFLKALFVKYADFRFCTAQGYLQFSYCRKEAECEFDFQEAAFEKASRVSFHTVRLRPNWFVNIDSRKFVFTDIDWCNLAYERGNRNIERELGALEKREITTQRKRLLEIAARQLAVNAEENNRYEEAAKFRYLAMETKRLEEGKFFSRLLFTLYKWTSGYGESWSWAALVLLILLLGFGVFYVSPLANFEPPEKKTAGISADDIPTPPAYYKMNNGEGFVYSLYVAALQRPEPKAADTTTRLLVILETIFAPLQVALLALAIRRKFMR